MKSAKTASAKDKAYALAKDLFPNGPVDVTAPVTVPGTSITILPFPSSVEKIWRRQADRLKGERKKPLLTPFGERVPESECFSFAKELIEPLPDEIRQIEEASLAEWEADMKEGVPRGYFDPIMYIARLFLQDPSWYPEEVKPGQFRPIPSYSPLPTIYDVEIREPQANVGFWRLTRWSDDKRSRAENERVHALVYGDAERWKMRALAGRITLASIKAISPPLAVFERAQSRGRPVQAKSKSVSLHGMRFIQPAQGALELSRPVWYAYGDRLTRLWQMRSVLNGGVGICSVDGDDFIVRSGDGYVMGDASAFDTSVSTVELESVSAHIASTIPRSELSLWYANEYACYGVDQASSVGMFSSPIMWGVRSGDEGTHFKDSLVEEERVRSADWSSAEKGIKHLGTRGLYRPDKQKILKKTVSMSQLIVSQEYPGSIFGLVSRMARSIGQMEDPVIRKEFLPWELDSRVVSVAANLYTGPCFEPFVKWVSGKWQLRSPRAEIMKRALDLMSKSRDQKMTSGKYEREAIAAVLKRM